MGKNDGAMSLVQREQRLCRIEMGQVAGPELDVEQFI